MTRPAGATSRLPRRLPRLLLALLALAVAGAVTLVAGDRHPAAADSPASPNIILLLTDDQATVEMKGMPGTQELLGAQGATFKRAYIPYPLCCPSRATLLSGRYMHNHGVRGNGGAYGGWPRFEDDEAGALPVRLQDEGYYTAHVGKYMNGYGGEGLEPHVPPGWDEWYGKLSESSIYFNYRLLEKESPGDSPELVQYGEDEADYQTDVFREKAVEFISGVDPSRKPFFLSLSFNAPHGPFIPAPRHEFLLSGLTPPKVSAFNEKELSDKPRWLQAQAKPIRSPLRQVIKGERRRRLEQLMAVDEAVEAIASALEARGILDETYILFVSDNGFFRGEHRIVGGKYLPYEPSARVPLLLRGPGIEPGTVSSELVSELDIAQTLIELAGGAIDPGLDGRSLLPYAQDPALHSTRPILLEADTGPGRGVPGVSEPAALSATKGVNNLDQENYASKSAAHGNRAPAYRAIRTERYLYALYATGDVELYDMKNDPAQLRSLHANPRFKPVRKWLFRRLLGLVSCDAAECREEIGAEPAPLPKPKRR
jgi:N-acetylglucosamine-6-sulfatase